MRVPSIPGYSRLTKTHKLSAAGIAAASTAALAFAVVPASADNTDAKALSAKPVALDQSTFGGEIQKNSLTQQSAQAAKQAKADAEAKKKAAAAAKAKAERDRVIKEQIAKKRAAAEAASRSAARKPVVKAASAPKVYANNLDGWIREALDVMKAKGIPGTYSGIHRNIMRESTGNPRAINNWDVNAANGIPSKGLLQVIDPTFRAYHVDGTSWDIYDPVANITAACNYAADRYGSIDNVNSAY
ncbi:transglycosylase SLT domain-containing protein [Streptomyces sp. XD-27]|uniref:transglycosylase SLT domain-containing protein n=1 Tax=Streptomyces sp. XD-27 TaxID=3062779 RepID=UPI0026F43E74|nr:transglycosylase SLT domain-containing protein [Streptomyces sp. XD-27]WKX69637.1 transglycosylase SLT domain-containing protein [Streptomyces sp. XD-27]